MSSNSKESSKNWVVYIIECSDSSLYTGITNNLPKRFAQHYSGKGAKFFYSRRPVRVVYAETGFERSSASKREMAIKQMRRDEKISLIQSEKNQAEKIVSKDFI